MDGGLQCLGFAHSLPDYHSLFHLVVKSVGIHIHGLNGHGHRTDVPDGIHEVLKPGHRAFQHLHCWSGKFLSLRLGDIEDSDHPVLGYYQWFHHRFSIGVQNNGSRLGILLFHHLLRLFRHRSYYFYAFLPCLHVALEFSLPRLIPGHQGGIRPLTGDEDGVIKTIRRYHSRIHAGQPD